MKQPQPSRFGGTPSVTTFRVGPNWPPSVASVYDAIEDEAEQRERARRWHDILSPIPDPNTDV